MDTLHHSDIDLPDREICYRALLARDTRFDGVFFTGVKTTGIYCRPVCRVKTPRASSCTFFANAASAEAAGYRPCLRCRPELAPYALQQNLAYAVWQRIAAGALNNGDLESLSQEVGLSSRQLRRVLQEHFGVSPVELAQTQRLLFAKLRGKRCYALMKSGLFLLKMIFLGLDMLQLLLSVFQNLLLV